ncbi:MAG: hypothetical protein JSV62_04660 [Promethearchaeota archaeon]|nr:MAG: hypothetical protein JSV62_04660 [Candidatus Lokiarchaeota archaeon]
MRNKIENRLHRVMIKLDKKGIVCPYAKECLISENSSRCNEFYQKCVKFTDFISDSK